MKSSSTKILSIAVALLLITNIVLVIFMVTGKGRNDGRHSGKGDPFQMMVKELNMTDQQQSDFKQLKEEHFKNSKPLFDSLRAAKIAFFSLVKDSTVSDSTLNAFDQRITERQAAVDKATFMHFRRVRNLFTAEQQPKFDEFVKKMMQRSRKDSAQKKDK